MILGQFTRSGDTISKHSPGEHLKPDTGNVRTQRPDDEPRLVGGFFIYLKLYLILRVLRSHRPILVWRHLGP